MSVTKTVVIIIMSIDLVGCNTKKKPILDSSKMLIEERVEVMKKIIEPLAKIPTGILDAHYTESKIGDGRLGPSDYFFYAFIKVSKGDEKKWSHDLKEPYNGVTQFYSPESHKK